MTNQDQAYDWDSPIENDGNDSAEAYVFPDGEEVGFEVTALTKATSQRLECPMAKMELRLFDDEHESRAFENMVLHSRAEWKLCQFFTAIGQRTHGEKIVPNWERVEGATGRCKVGVRTYKDRDGNDRETNEVVRYLDSDADAGSSDEQTEGQQYEF